MSKRGYGKVQRMIKDGKREKENGPLARRGPREQGGRRGGGEEEVSRIKGSHVQEPATSVHVQHDMSWDSQDQQEPKHRRELGKEEEIKKDKHGKLPPLPKTVISCRLYKHALIKK